MLDPVRGFRWRVARRLEARVSLCGAQARRRRIAGLGRRITGEDAGQGLKLGAAFGYSRYRVPAAGVEVFAVDPIRGDPVLRPGGEGDWTAQRQPGSGPRVRYQPSR